MKHSFRAWFLMVTTIFFLLAVAFFTYAWFTSNRAVSTNSATARTGEEKLELQLSSTGGSSFQDSQSVSITQVNKTDAGCFRFQRMIWRILSIHRSQIPEWPLRLRGCRMKNIIITDAFISVQQVKTWMREAR